jgi:hypothetical protein
MDNQCYFDGDFWQCVTSTNAGDSPDSAPTKWRRISIPKEWRQILKKLTYANLLELDGQTDKAAIPRSAGEALLDDLVREQVRQENDKHRGSAHALQGQTVKAGVILDDAYGLMRWDPDDLEDSQKADGRRSLSAALQQIWEAWWWGTLMVLEEAALRPVYGSATEYSQGAEVYFPEDRKYYLAIQRCVNIAPSVSGTVNTAFWAESKDAYCGAADFDGTQAYAWGTQVRNPVDGLFYQRAASYQTSGGGDDQFNQIYVLASLSGGYPQWASTISEATIQGFPGNWFFASADGNQGYSEPTDGQTPAFPDLVNNWQPYGLNGEPAPNTPAPTFARAFAAPAPPNTGHWGRLVRFDHVLTIERTERSVSRDNPLQCPNSPTYRVEPVSGGVRVPDWHCGTAWVWSRRITPVIAGNDFDNTATYEATPENDLVFDA